MAISPNAAYLANDSVERRIFVKSKPTLNSTAAALSKIEEKISIAKDFNGFLRPGAARKSTQKK